MARTFVRDAGDLLSEPKLLPQLINESQAAGLGGQLVLRKQRLDLGPQTGIITTSPVEETRTIRRGQSPRSGEQLADLLVSGVRHSGPSRPAASNASSFDCQ